MPQPVHYSRFPADVVPLELRQLDRWACWQVVPSKDGKKPGKPPIQATGKCFNGCLSSSRHVYARSNDPSTWGSFVMARHYLENLLVPKGRACGLSFALNGDGIVGIDLDDCRNPNNKTISVWAIVIIARFNSYTEITPSGTGIRIFIRGKLPPEGRKKGRIEVYDTNKFLSVTGRKVTAHGAGDDIEDRSYELLDWHQEVFGTPPSAKENKGHGVTQVVVNQPPDIDQARLERLFRDKPKAGEIFNCERNLYASQSEADLALANYAVRAGWTDQEVCDLLVGARQNADVPIKPAGYFVRTIAKAREGQGGKNRISEKGGAGSGGAGAENRNLNKGGAGPVTIEQARDTFCQHLYLPNPFVVDVALAVPAGNKLLQTDPLWLFLKGPPGSGKTELVNALRPLPEWAMLVSNLTPAALISGYGDPTRDEGDQSLLPQLDGKTLVIKDFTTILAMNPMQRDEIFGILRDCYDGHASKNFGTGRREYTSRFNLLAGVTNAIEGAWHLSQLGERFLVWAMDTDHKEQTKRAMRNANNEPAMREELAQAAAGVLAGLPDVVPQVPQPLQERTLTLAYLLARLRTYVARDRNDVVHRAPEVEVPTRIVKQLLRLGQSVALVRGKEEVTDDEFAIMRKVALDSVPSARLGIFNQLLRAKQEGRIYDVDAFAKKCRISHSPAKRHLDDMMLLGLAEPQVRDRKFYYRLRDDVWTEWKQVTSR